MPKDLNALNILYLIEHVVGGTVINNKDGKTENLCIFNNLRHRPGMIVNGNDKSKTVLVLRCNQNFYPPVSDFS